MSITRPDRVPDIALTADGATALIPCGAPVGRSGSTEAGHSKAVPTALSSAAFEARKQAVSRLLGDGAGVAARAGKKELRESLEGAHRHLGEGVLYVMVCGEFKRGKSKLINALLEDPGLVPVDVDIATNAVSVISYGERERILAYLDQHGGEPRSISRAELPDYVVESRNRGNRAGTRLVTIEVPNAKLRAGLALIDTPGVGGLNEAHNVVTYSFIANADAVLFVGDVVQPLSSKELEFAKLVAEHCEAVVFVLTKTDLEDDPETIVENTRRKLADVLGRPEDAITVVPVSSELKLHWLESGDHTDLEESNFAELERVLWDGLAARGGEMLVARALSELEHGMMALALPLRTERQVYAEHGKEDVGKLEQDLKQLEDHLKELTERRAEWRLLLSRGLEDIRSELQDEIIGKFLNLRRAVEHEYLTDDSLVMHPERVDQRLNKDIALLIGDLAKQFDRRAGTLVEDMRAATGLRLGDYSGTDVIGGLGKQLGERPRTIQVDLKSSKKGWETLRGGTYGGTPGALVGGIIGFLAGAIMFAGVGAAPGAYIGSAFGYLAGTVFGAKRQYTQLKERDVANARAQLQKETNQFIAEAQQQTRTALGGAGRDFERFAADEFARQLKTELEAVAGSRDSLREAKSRSQQDARRRQAEVEAALAPIERILDQVGRLREPPAGAAVPKTPSAAAGKRVDVEG